MRKFIVNYYVAVAVKADDATQAMEHAEEVLNAWDRVEDWRDSVGLPFEVLDENGERVAP